MIAVDTETTGLNPWRDPNEPGSFHPARPFGISISDMEGKTKFFRFEVDPFTREVLYEDKPEAYAALETILRSEETKVFQNAPFDLIQLRLAGFTVNGFIHDTKILAHVVTGGSEPTYALKPMCKKWFGFKDQDQSDIHKSTVKARRQAKKNGWCIAKDEMNTGNSVKADMWLGDRKLLKKYAVQDAERTALLFQFLFPKLEEDEGLKEVYERELELMHEVIRMQVKGTRVFPGQVESLDDYYTGYIERADKKRNEMGYGELNINSPKQMVRTFIEERGHDVIKYTKKGNVSVDNAALEFYASAEGDELANVLLDWKTAFKARAMNTAYRVLSVAEDFNTRILHPNFNTTGAVTGRLSCSMPNLQQAAAEKRQQHEGVRNRGRECFGPRDGHVWYLPDYSQIEVWLFAFLSGSEVMREALLRGEDFHSFNATTIWGDLPDFKTNFDYYRFRGKTIMFLKQYGGGVEAVATEIGCTRKEAQEFVDTFEARLPDVPRFINRMQNMARRQGHIHNPFGRLYKFRRGDEYKAVNYLIQGTAAEVMKNAIVNVGRMLRERWSGCHILLTIHDELIVEVPFSFHSKQLMNEIIFEMQRDSKRVGLPVPFPVEMKWTHTRWNNVHKVKLAA